MIIPPNPFNSSCSACSSTCTSDVAMAPRLSDSSSVSSAGIVQKETSKCLLSLLDDAEIPSPVDITEERERFSNIIPSCQY